MPLLAPVMTTTFSATFWFIGATPQNMETAGAARRVLSGVERNVPALS
jgi:hypothetical protein